MGSSTGNGGDNEHIIHIWEVNKERLASMQEKIKATPKLLSKSAGNSSCSIFRVPQKLTDLNGRAYQPQIVSIGPYHHGDPQLQMLEEHKWRLLGTLLVKTQTKLGLTLEDYLKAIQPLEVKARECYPETIGLSTDEFIEMLVLDGCFIIELFRRFGMVTPADPDDPLVSMSWVLSSLLKDLIRIENQIPFFVLQRLFDITEVRGQRSLSELAVHFFNNGFLRPYEVIDRFKNCDAKHLLHFLRSTFIFPEQEEPKSHKLIPLHLIHSISKLRDSGIKVINAVSSDSFLLVKFRHGVIEMPTVALDDFMSCFMANCVAFEQCQQYCSKHFTTYATFLDCLIKISDDVNHLCDQNIVENYFGTNDDVAKFMNNLGKDLSFNIEECYLSNLFISVNEHYMNNWQHFKNSWRIQWGNFWDTYFSSPWSFISLVAAVLLLVATMLQTYYTILSYVMSNRD